MSTLRTDYKDDSFTGRRKYEEINNGDGTVSFNDVTDYAQNGDTYGAAQINELNTIVNTLDEVTYKTTDPAETAIADNDYFPFYDTSAGKQRKTLWSNTKTTLQNTFAIKNHATNQSTYGLSSSALFGHCKLYDDYTTNGGAAAAGVAASSKALYDAYSVNKNLITTANGNLNTLKTNLNTTNSNLSTLTNRVNSDDTEIASLRNRISTNERNITSLGTRAATLENELTANGKRLYMDYKNGKYGINTSSSRGASTFIPFKDAAFIGSCFPHSIQANASGTQNTYYGADAMMELTMPADGYVTVTRCTSQNGREGGAVYIDYAHKVYEGDSLYFSEGDVVHFWIYAHSEKGASRTATLEWEFHF